MRNLDDVLKHLFKHGTYDDFRNDGKPTSAAVRKLLGKATTRQEIDDAWFRLYGFSTCREDLSKR